MKILFVCLGNICRSPTAEGVFRKIVDDVASDVQVEVDSAGTHAYHTGEPPDRRSQAAALQRGVDLSLIRARPVVAEDFQRFDLILAMDESNYHTLLQRCPEEQRYRVRLFLEFLDDDSRREVPDPYYGGANGFEFVLDLVEEAAKALAEHVRGASGRG